jgi:hypothetical protein
VLLVDRSTHTGLGVRAPIYPVGLTLQFDRAEVQARVKCDLIKRSRILSFDMLIVGYLLEELIASRLLRLIMLILRALLFRSQQGITQMIG